MNSSAHFPPSLRAAALVVLSVAHGLLSAEEVKFGAAGWMQYGAIGSSSDTIDGVDLDGRQLISSGAQIVLTTRFFDKLDIEAGLGVGSGHAIPGKIKSDTRGYAIMGVGPYVAQANFRYSFVNQDASKLSLRGGLFAYDYAPESQNLGLYLLRGPVYPGILLSGFETKHVLPVANMLGLQLHHEIGGFQHDLLLSVETEFYPYYDLSPAYVAGFQFGKLLRVGGGVNFYHLIPVDDSLTNDPTRFYEDTTGVGNGGVPDTTFLSFSGIKVMANASLDPKALMGNMGGLLGDADLKIYGEVAIIGLKNDAVYRSIYGDTKHRMPLMFGFNFPAFKLLDHIACEVEWYGAPFQDNLDGFKHVTTQVQPWAPYPYRWVDSVNIRRDNWKWSIHGSKVIGGHVKASFQVANDHFRPGIFQGYGDNLPPATEAVMVRPKNWYWMTKIAYFF